MPLHRAVQRSRAVLRAQSWAYDASSKVTHHTVDGVTTSYTYDGAGQLLSESRPGYQATYTYDGNGNRLTRTVNGVTETYTYDAGDKLLSVSVGGVVVRSFGYDAAGRTTSVTSSAGTTTLTYDFEGRATSIVGPGVSQFNVFNGLDTRVGSTTNSVTRSFLRDGAYVTDPVLSDGAAFYTPGVSERRGSLTTFLHSGLKNADAQSTASGLSGARQYDAFGNLLSSSGAWQGPFGYAGAFGYQSDTTGLMLLGHRLYDPSTGRFLTRDPIQDGRNWYVYCGNDPVNRTDPDGLTPKVLLVIPVALYVWDIYDFIQDPSPETLFGLIPGPGKYWRWADRLSIIDQSARKKIDDAADAIMRWIGPGGTIKPSKKSDLVIVSADEQRVIHFDLSNPGPHLNPHVDIEEKGFSKVRVYPIGVERR